MSSSRPVTRWRIFSTVLIAWVLASPAWSATSTQPAGHRGKLVPLKGSREPFNGYLVEPAGKGPFPAVVVIMEWWGLNDQIKGVADRLATAGYAALVPDLYYGQVTADPEKAHELMRGLDPKVALTDLGSAMDYLRSLPEVGKSKIGSLGFCMGGGLSLQLALNRPDLSGAVMFYGQPDTDPVALDKAACPVLGNFGAEDQGIPAAKIQEMAKQLNEVGEGADVKIYPGAGHAFFNETRPSYNAAAAADAWTRTLTFFKARLKG
jgi:carboxymethylenebutenolidase